MLRLHTGTRKRSRNGQHGGCRRLRGGAVQATARHEYQIFLERVAGVRGEVTDIKSGRRLEQQLHVRTSGRTAAIHCTRTLVIRYEQHFVLSHPNRSSNVAICNSRKWFEVSLAGSIYPEGTHTTPPITLPLGGGWVTRVSP
eukprot:1196326-Prorocentrum_minimum.AAC.7